MSVKGLDDVQGRATIPRFFIRILGFWTGKGKANRLMGKGGAGGLDEIVEKEEETETTWMGRLSKF